MHSYALKSHITKVVDAFIDCGSVKVLPQALELLIDNMKDEEPADISLTIEHSRVVSMKENR